MNDIKKRFIDFEFKGKTYPLTLSLNVIDEIQNRYGEFDINTEKVSEIKWLLTTLINEAVDIHNDESEDKWEYLSERYVGRYMDKDSIQNVSRVIADLSKSSLPATENEDDDELENAISDIPKDEEEEKNTKAE